MSVLSFSAAHAAEVDNPFGTGLAAPTKSTVTTPVKKTTTTSQKKTTSSKTKSSLGGSCGSYPRTWALLHKPISKGLFHNIIFK